MAKVIIIGSGGREHALAWKFHQSRHVETVYVAPGNPGMCDVATLVPIEINDFEELANFVIQQNIDLTFVGPETPLVDGIVDYFEERNLRIFGPSKQAARLEGSKVFSKMMMAKYQLPTANYQSFSNYQEAKTYLVTQDMPIVLKADGLAAGKGVIIAHTLEEAQTALEDMMCNELFASAGANVVIESYLEGEEFSLMAFVNHDKVIPMPIVQDHKRAFDHDQGLNTGGMGAYTPVNHIPVSAVNEAMDKVMKPISQAMIQEGTPFVGVLYGGFMLTKDGVKTIEFNVRFGDPETEVLMLSLESDLYSTIQDILDDKEVSLSWNKQAVLGVVLAAKGYPLAYQKGSIIQGLEKVVSMVFHMGTTIKENQIQSSGGRVLFIAGCGKTLEEAKHKVYEDIKKIECSDLFYRTDIGFRGIK